MAYEAARILDYIGVHVRVFNPAGLPIKDEANVNHPKVQELRALSAWSDGHFWVSPEQHGNLVLPLYSSVTVDGSIQESNRLDSTVHRFSPTYSRKDIRNMSSQRRKSKFQHCEFITYSGTMDENVYYSQSIFSS
jgi:arsenic resistance protein ArsH